MPRRPSPSPGGEPGVPTTPRVAIYTDGACSGNPGPGGWAAILIDGNIEQEISGGEPWTTNQRMEMMGVLQGLRALAPGRAADVHSDSAYVVNGFRDKWYVRWRANGWKNSQKKPVENRDLWEALLGEVESRDVAWHKVAGHSGHPLNDRADRLAVDAIRRVRAEVAPPAR
jgi:ribonuclease HI